MKHIKLLQSFLKRCLKNTSFWSIFLLSIFSSIWYDDCVVRKGRFLWKKENNLNSRIGFILLSAGCAIGIGNVWRFPYVVGENGGGIFVLFYLFFLLLIGVPILSMEFSVGRASKKSVVKSFQALEKTNQKWHLHGYMSLVGNICLMIFYTTVSGWMLKYFYNFLTGQFNGLTTADVSKCFFTSN